MGKPERERTWTFLTHHAHVLLALSRDPTLRIIDIAEVVGITERATAGLVSDLIHGGYLLRFKDGRRNRYQLELSGELRHPMNGGFGVGTVITPLSAQKHPRARAQNVKTVPDTP
jgi:hypothetical protein